jgi:hypothetical protein
MEIERMHVRVCVCERERERERERKGASEREFNHRPPNQQAGVEHKCDVHLQVPSVWLLKKGPKSAQESTHETGWPGPAVKRNVPGMQDEHPVRDAEQSLQFATKHSRGHE